MENESDSHSVHFANYAAKLERHLRNNGIACHDADLIIEESSIIYFEKLRSEDSRLLRLVRKYEPADLFVESACIAIGKYLPGSRDTFGSEKEIERCIR